MARLTAVSDKVRLEDSGSNEVLQNFAQIQSTSFDVNTNVDYDDSIGYGKERVGLTDGVSEQSVDLTWNSDTFRSLELLGTYDSNNDEVTLDDTLPEFTYKTQTLSDETVEVSNVKFETIEILIESEGQLEFTASGEGTTATFNSNTTLSQTVYSDSALTWGELQVKIDGNILSSATSAQIEITRSLERDVTIGNSDPENFTAGLLDITATIDHDASESEWDRIFNDRTEFDVTLEDKNSAESITLKDCKLEDGSMDKDVSNEGTREATLNIRSRSEPVITTA